jgi:single-strand DNA-binding protein
MSLPVITGVARLTDDPELRYAASGTAVCKVRLAFNSRKKNESGQWEDGDTFFVDGTVFNQEAEHVAESLQRGHEVVVTGRLKTRRYETKEGEKRSVVELMVDGIGPALKFATAKVNKMQRTGGSTDSRPAPAADDPWSTAGPSQGSRSSFNDEPPF